MNFSSMKPQKMQTQWMKGMHGKDEMQNRCCFWQISFYSTNACGYFHNEVVFFMARVSHMLTRPYGIVILSDFDFIFCFVQFLCASLSLTIVSYIEWITIKKNRPNTVNADKMHKRFRQPWIMVFTLWRFLFIAIAMLQPEKIMHIFLGRPLLHFYSNGL